MHRLRVRAEWLEEGAAIEFELPRNVTCAECEGGGCDRCDRSGAITLRGKNELSEVVQVVERTVSGRALVIRIPQRGGYADDPELPRGMLMLSVVPADEPDPGVVRVEQPLPSLAEKIAASVHPEAIGPARGPRRTAAIVVTALVILWIALLVWLRVTGRG